MAVRQDDARAQGGMVIAMPNLLLSGLILLCGPAVPATGERAEIGPGLYEGQPEFEYFANPWSLIGLPDYTNGTRVTPEGHLLLGGGVRLEFLFGPDLARVERPVRMTWLADGAALAYTVVDAQGARYTVKAFAAPLRSGPGERGDWLWPDSTENFVNWVEVTAQAPRGHTTLARAAVRFVRDGEGIQRELRQESAGVSSAWAGGKVIALVATPKAGEAGADELVGQEAAAQPEAHAAPSLLTLAVPFSPVDSADALGGPTDLPAAMLDTYRQMREVYGRLLGRGTEILVSERKPLETYRTAVIGQFVARDKGVAKPGEGFYDGLFLRDGAYQIYALALAGYLREAKQSLEFFLDYQKPDGQFVSQEGELDGNGQALWALVEYYELSRDRAWLERVYPQIAKAVEWLKAARRRDADPNSPYRGVLFASPADGENLWTDVCHIVGYDVWNLRGVQCAAEAAEALGKTDDGRALRAEFDAYRADVLRALERTGLDYLPPSYEKRGTHWGDLEVVFPTPLMDPHDPLVSRTLEEVHRGFVEGTIRWSPDTTQAIHPYMSQFVTNTHIIRGDHDLALDGFYSFLLHSTSTDGFPEGVLYRTRTAWGDTVPHQWASAMYIIDLRNMLVREDGDELHLASCLPSRWLRDGDELVVRDAPTEFGEAGFRMTRRGDRISVAIYPPRRNPPDRIILHLPPTFRVRQILRDDGASLERTDGGDRLVLEPAVHHFDLIVHERRDRRAMSYDRVVERYLKTQRQREVRTEGLDRWPPAGIAAEDCTFLDLRPFATTDPFSAPFNVPNPGDYLFTGLPTGRTAIQGLLFDLIDPARNGGKGLVVLQGAGACADMPASVTIPVGLKGSRLLLLGNVGGWSPGDPGAGEDGAVARYIIRYSDGAEQVVPLISGRTIDDWAMPPNARDMTATLRGEGIWHLHILSIRLRPRRVESIEFRDEGTPTSPVLAAMTVVR
jgi:hypothetical protein